MMQSQEQSQILTLPAWTERKAVVPSGLGRLLRRQPLGTLGACIIALLLAVAVLAPQLEPYGVNRTSVAHRLEQPSSEHVLGTDNLGRDELSRLIDGSRVTVTVGFGSVLIAIALATAIGTTSAYLGGLVDLAIQRMVDIWLSFPGIVLLTTIVSMFKPSRTTVVIAIGVLLAAGASRVVRSAVLAVKPMAFIESARCSGAIGLRIVARHVLPNVIAPILVVATAQLGVAILIEATLSFLGYGVPPPQPAWGSMLSGDARTFMVRAPLLSLWPGLAIALVVYAFNMLGDAIRDEMDPRLRGGRS
jgi:peptide/nickel transport system permease protein